MQRFLEFVDSVNILFPPPCWQLSHHHHQTAPGLREVKLTCGCCGLGDTATAIAEQGEWREHGVHGLSWPMPSKLWLPTCTHYSHLSLAPEVPPSLERQKTEKFGGLSLQQLIPTASCQEMARGSMARKPNKPIGVDGQGAESSAEPRPAPSFSCKLRSLVPSLTAKLRSSFRQPSVCWNTNALQARCL